MSLAVFNINDAGIQVGVDGDLIRTSPGYAVLDNEKLMTGELAAENARLLPRWTNNRFWSQLTTAPIAGSTHQIRHHADLAFAHLEALWQSLSTQPDEALLIVPGYYTNDNLGLLLGMAKECGIPVKGVVDHSVLAASNLPLRQVVLHLDIHLHAITLTRLDNTGTLVRRDVKTIMETGLSTLWDRWATIIANQFIQSTRFDPMVDASSEQTLFNRLPSWIAGLGPQGMHSFEITTSSAEHQVAISNESLLRAVTPLYPQLVQAIRSEIPTGDNASLLISHRFDGFPGLTDSLGLIPDAELINLGELKSIGSAYLHRDELISNNGAVSHIIQMKTGEVTTPVATKKVPTHLLWQNHGYAIGAGFKLGADLSAGPHRSDTPIASLYQRNHELIMECHEPGVLLNGEAASPTNILQPGDQLGFEGEKLTLISVSGDG